MTQKLYETDAYVQEFAAAVLSCTPAKGGYAVVLERLLPYLLENI